MKFHSPYQFINIRPAKATIQYRNTGTKQREIHSDYIRHDYWAKDGLSGCIHCRLSCQTPLVTGARQSKASKKAPATVSPYRHPDGTLALPANSLRGMLSSLTETLSQSSLRILADEKEAQYSVRQTPGESFKKLGLLLKTAQGYQIKPLADLKELKKVGDYKNRNNKDNKFIKTHKSYQHQDNPQFISAIINGDYANNLRELDNNDTPPANSEKGILYIRGKHFSSKKYEYFIPWNNINLETGTIPVKQQAIEQTQRTLRRYQDKEKPENALPQGYQRDWQDEKAALIKAGDLIYYKTDKDDQGNAIVTQLSYSQTWRRPVLGNLYDAIQKTGDKNSLPWNPDRTHLTPAEALFGVVENNVIENNIESNAEARNNNNAALNLASRLYFTDALPVDSITLQAPVILKILDSPKPPSPAMYFQAQNGQKPVSKKDLDLTKHTPNGRKHYLPHSQKLHPDRENWESRYNNEKPQSFKQYLKVQPVPAGSEFHFQIHFDNLAEEELGLLLTALQPADETTYRHRLGLGKPLGLGEITLTIDKLQARHKHNDYTLEALQQAQAPWMEINKEQIDHYKQLALEKGYIDKKTLEEVQTLFNPDNIKHPVCYPFSSPHKQQAGEEGEGFQWFVMNDKLSQEHLKTVNADEAIAELDSFEDQFIVISGLDKIPYDKKFNKMKVLINQCQCQQSLAYHFYEKEENINIWLFKSPDAVTNIMGNNDTITKTIRYKNRDYSVTLSRKY